MANGFLNRWSRRKAGEQLEPEKTSGDDIEQRAALTPEVKEQSAEIEDAPLPATLDDVEKIDRFAPDFSAFMKPGVDPAVQQAAMKKMFTDPHFNVMDGLDIYIDDYSKSDPIPLEMLKRMVQSDMLNLFRKDKEEEQSELVNSLEAKKPTEQVLQTSHQTDLRSTPLAIEGGGEKHSLPVDKNTSEENDS